MNKFQKIGLRIFSTFFVFAVIFSYVVNSSLFEKSEKPWHMQPFTDEDSLSKDYLDKYEVVQNLNGLVSNLDSTQKVVLVLVDAWGVPFEETLLEDDFAAFDDVSNKTFLHVRKANRTRHAEFAEFRNSSGGGLYLFGGDSLEYGRNLYVDSLGYSERIFCQRCDDASMVSKLDSVLSLGEKRVFAMTMQDSRDGISVHLHGTLTLIAEVAKKHPEARFIVQGTHRPILGDSKIRKEHYAKWVPLVVLN